MPGGVVIVFCRQQVYLMGELDMLDTVHLASTLQDLPPLQ